jgi:hypothetical protein
MESMRIGSNPGERGAVSIKSVLIFTAVAFAVFSLIKLVPVYVEESQIKHDADEVARKASLGISAYGPDKIDKAIKDLITEYALPEGSVAVTARGDNTAQITVKYSRPIDFYVTTYDWSVDYVAMAKGL